MGSATKLERYLTREELPAFLRELADALEQAPAEGEFACVADFRKLKLAVKHEFEQVTVKLKAKGPEACAAEEALEDESGGLGKPKYKHLKKRMKSSFKLLFRMLHEGQMPPEAAVRSFVEDSRLMVSYPGYGDEDYEEYSRAVEEFETAYEQGALELAQEAAHKLSAIKGHCHSRYA
jgi:XXXCH domain-containing protein